MHFGHPWFLAVASSIGILVATAQAGSLTPPGAPAPTPVDLETINDNAAAARSNASSAANEARAAQDPRIAISEENTPGSASAVFRITESGSYYLTGDIQGQSGAHGIEIAASDVTLDLNGFTLRGVAGSLNGISSNASNETILNGSVIDWGDVGVALGDGSRLESIRAINNDIGCVVGEDCQVFECLALENSSDGFRVGDRSVIRDCVGSRNGGGSGFPNGFQMAGDCVITNCVAEGNESVGISCGFGSVVEGSAAIGNGYIGIAVSSHSTITDSISRGNHSGISTGNNTVVRGCTANENHFYGIWVAHDRCLIENNVCNQNAQAGIIVLGTYNRIDGNHVMQNRNGVRVVDHGNFVLRNTAGGSTGTGTPSAAYDFGSTFTSHGPIIYTGGVINSVNPWANFDYLSPL